MGALVLVVWPGAAVAHATDQAFVLLLPTGVYTIVGVIAVAATFLLTVILPHGAVPAMARSRKFVVPPGKVGVSLCATAVLFGLLFAGLYGSRDPTANPLPLVFWTLFWVAFVSLSGFLGNLWAWVNPWHGLLRGLVLMGVQPAFRLTERAADTIAVLSLLAFAGFLLADPAPADPARLSFFGALYWGGTLLGAAICGPVWLQRAELFAALLRWFGALSALRWEGGRMGWPGWQVVTARGSAAYMLLPLVMLGTGSFDGFNETFVWLGWLGINPLEFPGRSAVQVANTVGLLAAITVLGVLFFGAVALGQVLASPVPGATLRLAPTVLPIALAYHIAHYLPGFLVEIQYVAGMFARLIGLEPPVVTTGFFFDPNLVRLIWIGQGLAVVVGHIHAIYLAHIVALDIYGTRRRAVLSQVPLGCFMIAYTFFGLWLLAAPKGA